ncbi:hypothetical protein GQ53DRAFT_123107 [Thozetella sp. PMI_491]|nr:hypothetical protein GQ53DRAFT_123107 [Thozetella sp. PMI_491]
MGRPPITGYCLTCRRRRVKCDRGRPACARCLKAGFTCAGYGLPLRMQHHVVDQSRGLVRVPGGVSAIAPPIRPQELSLVGFEDQIASSFYFSSYRWAYFWRPIMRLAPEGSADPFFKASSAVTLGYLAKVKHVPELTRKATELSTCAVNWVRRAVSDGSRAETAGMLTAIGALGIYNYAVEQKFHYVHHYGTHMIMQFCGPTYFQSQPNLACFRHSRMMLFCCSLALRCKTFLSEELWKTAPFQLTPKTTEDRLFDILVDIPELVERISVDSRSLLETEEITEKLRSLRSNMTCWRMEWGAFNAASTKEVRQYQYAGHFLVSPIALLLSSVLVCRSAQQAVELLYYNAAMLYLCQLECVLEGRAPDQHMNMIHAYHQVPVALGVSKGQGNQPLLLPNEVRFPWQYGMEGLRILANLRVALAACPEVYLPFAPIAILYCFARDLSIQGSVLSMISSEEWAAEAEAEFGHYCVSPPGTPLTHSSEGADQNATASHGSFEIPGISGIRQLFLKGSHS